jgi:hypothetical protein
MYTVDASVHLSALKPAEADFASSLAFLRLARQRGIPVFCTRHP